MAKTRERRQASYGFDDVERMCRGHGLTAVQRSPFHWQIVGNGELVNLWPSSSKAARGSNPASTGIRSIGDIERFMGMRTAAEKPVPSAIDADPEDPPRENVPVSVCILKAAYWDMIRDGRLKDAEDILYALDWLTTV